MLYTAASFRRDSWKFFLEVCYLFLLRLFISRPSSRDTTVELGLWRMQSSRVLSEGVANVLFFTQRRLRCVCINWRHQKESWGGFGFSSFQSKDTLRPRFVIREKCCYASLNKLVFKQSFLWFTADGGLMWLMLPFKTLILLVVSQPSPLFPGLAHYFNVSCQMANLRWFVINSIHLHHL